jgi:hypothetical protein
VGDSAVPHKIIRLSAAASGDRHVDASQGLTVTTRNDKLTAAATGDLRSAIQRTSTKVRQKCTSVKYQQSNPR